MERRPVMTDDLDKVLQHLKDCRDQWSIPL